MSMDSQPKPKKDRVEAPDPEGPDTNALDRSPDSEPDMRQLFQADTMDTKGQLIRDLITSDNNNETKTRIPDAFNMSVMDLLGEVGRFKTLSSINAHFGKRFRINAISKSGLAREEYTDAVMGSDRRKEKDDEKERLKEGSRK